MYNKLGFNLDHISKPNYEWISDDHTIRLNRLNCFKSNIKKLFDDYNDNLSIKDNMINNKFYQLFDCR
jgi:hypothetical protein